MYLCLQWERALSSPRSETISWHHAARKLCKLEVVCILFLATRAAIVSGGFHKLMNHSERVGPTLRRGLDPIFNIGI